MSVLRIMPPPKVKVRFILPGGGIRATFQVAFIDEMMATGMFEVDRVYGTSAGAILAPFVVANETNKAIDMLKTIRKTTDVFEPYPFGPFPINVIIAFFTLSMFRKNRFIDRTIEYFKGREHVYEKCEVVAWDLLNKKERWFTGAELPIGIRASAALWVVTPPIAYENTYYVDGVVTELLPVTRVIDSYNDESNNVESEDLYDGIYVMVECSKRCEAIADKPKNLVDLMFQLQQDSIDQLANRELSLIQQKLGNKLFIVTPTSSPFTTAIDIDQKKIAASFEEGRTVFREWFEAQRNAIFPTTI